MGTKQCEECGASFERRRNKNGKLIGYTIFTKQRFCSNRCAAIARMAAMERDARGIDALHEILNYNPQTGVWTWKVRRSMRAGPGSVAGSLNADGHRQIEINDKTYMSSRLAWLYMTGEWPAVEVDHIDPSRPWDDSWENLREATRRNNCGNRRRRSDNASGYKGVVFHKRGYPSPWQAYIGIASGKHKNLGYYKTPEEAHAAYCAAAREKYGEFFNAG